MDNKPYLIPEWESEETGEGEEKEANSSNLSEGDIEINKFRREELKRLGLPEGATLGEVKRKRKELEEQEGEKSFNRMVQDYVERIKSGQFRRKEDVLDDLSLIAKSLEIEKKDIEQMDEITRMQYDNAMGLYNEHFRKLGWDAKDIIRLRDVISSKLE